MYIETCVFTAKNHVIMFFPFKMQSLMGVAVEKISLQLYAQDIYLNLRVV